MAPIGVQREGDGVVVVFGATGAHDDTLEAFVSAMGHDAVHVTFDFTAVASGSGLPWQEALLPRRAQLKSLTLIAASPAERVSALALAEVLGVSVTLKTVC